MTHREEMRADKPRIVFGVELFGVKVGEVELPISHADYVRHHDWTTPWWALRQMRPVSEDE